MWVFGVRGHSRGGRQGETSAVRLDPTTRHAPIGGSKHEGAAVAIAVTLLLAAYQVPARILSTTQARQI